MSRNEVIEAYVVDVLRRLPGKDRTGIGFELRGLLADMLADRAQAEGREADDAMVLAMLREFGTPAEVASRYRPPGRVLIPAEQTRVFVPLAIGGLLLQWALTLPRVFDGQPLVAWWFTWGLGAFWWPGFLVMASLAEAWLRERGLFKTAQWSPRTFDPERVNRPVLGLALFGIAAGATLLTSLPWLAPRLPGALPQVFAFDPQFLHQRAWPAVLLWAASLALYAYVYMRGRWSTLTRHVEMVLGLVFVGVMAWWLAAGPMFVAKATDDGARLALGFVAVVSLASLVHQAVREGVRIRTPRAMG